MSGLLVDLVHAGLAVIRWEGRHALHAAAEQGAEELVEMDEEFAGWYVS